jgi:hypothetical protein
MPYVMANGDRGNSNTFTGANSCEFGGLGFTSHNLQITTGVALRF